MTELRIIDVSQWNGWIDWEKAKGNIDGAIIRCGYGSDYEEQDDTYFERNADECERLGIPYGVYLYSYAVNDWQAVSEAAHAIRLCDGRKLSYPLYFDTEEPGTEWAARNCATVFCEKVEEAGYFAGIYASQSWWLTYLGALDRWTKWVARWGSSSAGLGCDMWQYTSNGSVPGIQGRVDMNICYRDFPAEIGETEMITDSDIDKIAQRTWEYIYHYGQKDEDRILQNTLETKQLSNGYNVLREAFKQAFEANSAIKALESKIDELIEKSR